MYVNLLCIYMFQGSGILRKVPSKCQPGQLVGFLGIGSSEGKWLCAKTPVNGLDGFEGSLYIRLGRMVIQ